MTFQELQQEIIKLGEEPLEALRDFIQDRLDEKEEERYVPLTPEEVEATRKRVEGDPEFWEQIRARAGWSVEEKVQKKVS